MSERGATTRSGASFHPADWEVDTDGERLRRVALDASGAAVPASRAELRGMLQQLAASEDTKKEYESLVQRVAVEEKATVELQLSLQDKDLELTKLRAELDAVRVAGENVSVQVKAGHDPGPEEVSSEQVSAKPMEGQDAQLVAQLAAAQKNTESQLSELRSLILSGQRQEKAAPMVMPEMPVAPVPAVGMSASSSGVSGGPSAEYAGHKPGDVHNYFKNQLSKVAVAKKGDVNFATARASWKSLMGLYPVSLRVQLQLLGYAFTGTAYKMFLVVMADPRNEGCSAEEIWQRMASRLYNTTMVQTQRSKMTATMLEPGESVGDLLERLTELSMGLPEMEGAGGDDALAQRLVDALPDGLQVHALGLSGGLDSKVAALDAIQAKLSKAGKAVWRRRPAEAVQAIVNAGRTGGELSDEIVAAVGGPEFVAAIQSTSGYGGCGERARNGSFPSRELDSRARDGSALSQFQADKTKPQGHPLNPVGPNPARPEDRLFYSTRRQCYGCRRFGHQRTGRDGQQVCEWEPASLEKGNEWCRAAAGGGPPGSN